MQVVGCHSRSRITRPVIAKPGERLHRFQGHKLYTHEFILEKACRRKLCAELAKRQLHSYGCISVVIDLELLTVRARCEQTDLLNNILLLPSFASGQRVPSLSVNPMPHVSDRASNKQVFLQSVLTNKLAWLSFLVPKVVPTAEYLLPVNTGNDLQHKSRLHPIENMDLTCYPHRGANVHVYIIDTGCRVSHEQLNNKRVTSYPNPGSQFGYGKDDHGHGTHIAATIVGKDFGLATAAHVVCIKTFSGAGKGSSANIVSAINHVIEVTESYRLSNSSPRAVIMSMSLGVRAPVEYSELDEAVTRAALAGILPIVAAGNGGLDACEFTPARAPGAIAVGGLASNGRLASFSNRGRCVLLAAPGESVLSAHHKSDAAYAIGSGTSLAVPFVSALAAMILGERPHLSPADVLRELTTRNRKADGIDIATLPVCA
jgi:Subtilase family